MNVNKNVVIITGASGGMGSATINCFLASGYKIFATDRNIEPLKKLMDQFPNKIELYKADLSSTSEIEKMVEYIQQNYKKVSWIINIAGFISKEAELQPNQVLSTFQETLSVNMLAPSYISKLLIPTLTNGIINIGSTATLGLNPDFPVYGSSKAAITYFSRALAKEFEEKNIKLSCFIIIPAATNTAMRQMVAGDAHIHQKPEVIANTIFKLTTAETLYKNGDMIIVRDGEDKLYTES